MREIPTLFGRALLRWPEDRGEWSKRIRGLGKTYLAVLRGLLDPKPRTRRVRICVAFNAAGEWSAA